MSTDILSRPKSWSKWLPFSSSDHQRQQLHRQLQQQQTAVAGTRSLSKSRSKSSVYLTQAESAHNGLLVTQEFDYPIALKSDSVRSHSKSHPSQHAHPQLPQSQPVQAPQPQVKTVDLPYSPDLSSPSCSTSSDDHTHFASFPTVHPENPNSPPSSYRPPAVSPEYEQKRQELIRALHETPSHRYPDPSIATPSSPQPKPQRRSRKLRKPPPTHAHIAVPLTDLSFSPQLEDDTDTPSPGSSSTTSSRPISVPPSHPIPFHLPSSASPQPYPYPDSPHASSISPLPSSPTPSSNRTSTYSHTPLLASSYASPRTYPSSTPVQPTQKPPTRKLSKRRPAPNTAVPVPSSPSSSAAPSIAAPVIKSKSSFTHTTSDPTPARKRRPKEKVRKAVSENGHDGEGVEIDVMEWLPPVRAESPFKLNMSTHQTWHERTSFLSSPPRTQALPRPRSRTNAGSSIATDALASLAWTGVSPYPVTSTPSHSQSQSRFSHFSSNGEPVVDGGADYDNDYDYDYDPYDPRPSRRWTLATALMDEGVTDEVLVAELERMRVYGGPAGSDEPGDGEAQGERDWKAARRALLCCRELVRTERRYQEGLRALLQGETTTPPPLLIGTYLPALLRASEMLLARLEDDPSAWGVAAAFMGCEDELEAAMVSWCHVVGEVFASHSVDKDNKSPTKLISPKPSSSPVRTTGTGLRGGNVGDVRSGMWRKSMPEVGGGGKTSSSRGAKIGKEERRKRASVRDLAIQPTQRIMRYVLLYRDLLAHTPSSSPSRALVENALEAALRIAKMCDRAQGNAAFFLRGI